MEQEDAHGLQHIDTSLLGTSSVCAAPKERGHPHTDCDLVLTASPCSDASVRLTRLYGSSTNTWLKATSG